MALRTRKRWMAALLVLVVAAGWVVLDFARPGRHSLRDFDPHEVARLETAMWRSYYDHRSLRLFTELVELLRGQYHLPFWRATAGAYYAARAAVVFQPGHLRAEYERALPAIERYYALIRASSDTGFPVDQVSRLELEWWIVHRERSRHAPGDLARALAELQAGIFGQPAERFADHARPRAEAMVVCDEGNAAGGVTERGWAHIEALLDASWSALHEAVNR